MISFATLTARRALRLLAVACVFAFTDFIPAAGQVAGDAVLPLCPECGREAAGDARFCPACGARLDSAGGEDARPGGVADAAPAADSAPATADVEATPSSKAAAVDVAEARRRRGNGEKAAALVLFRNAQALLAARTDGDIPAKSMRTLAAEAEQANADFKAAFAPLGRSKALAVAARSLEDFFRGEGRVPMGRAWVPSDWPGALPPESVAFVRLSLPLQCADCHGAGVTQCRTCGGRGQLPCKATGCKGGFVYSKPKNSLSPKSELMVKDKCPSCQGRAAVPCKECSGSGAITCRRCGGDGNAQACGACGGTGLAICRDCAQKGARPDCPACRGTGKKLCGKCGGDGRTTR